MSDKTVAVVDSNPETLNRILALQAAGLEVKKFGEADPFVIVPPEHRLESIANLLPPTRVKQTVTLQEAESFADYVNRFKTPATLIFATLSETSVRLTAVIDYHGEGAGGKPGRCEHTAVFDAIETPEWKVWCAADRKPMDQVKFAEWLEDNLRLFVEPKGADLLELVTTLHGHANARFKDAVRLANGSFTANYEEDVVVRGGSSTTKDGAVELPATIEAGIVPFQGALTYSVKARLKTRIVDRKLHLFIETIDKPKIIRDVILQLVAQISEKTAIIPFHGSHNG